MSEPNLSSFIWSVADLLRGDYKQSEYGKVILPFTVLRRLDCVLEDTKPAVLAEKKLREKAKLKPEPFLLKKSGQHFFNYDPATGKTERIPPETVKRLLEQGRGRELRETLEPDVVIHIEGASHQAQAVYDYKFPCVNTDQQSRWREYSEGRADGAENQGDLYRDALKVAPWRVQPHLGVY